MAEQDVRAFVALELPEAVQEGLWEVQDVLQSHRVAEELRWVEPESTHLTLKFLSDIAIARLPSIVEALDSVAERWQPFEVRIGPLGAYPNVHEPHTLWLAADAERRALIHLFNAVEVALKPLGIRPERRNLHPHLTLARVPRDWPTAQKRAVGDLVGQVPLPEVPSFTADSMALIRSELTRSGPIYTRLARARFGEPPPLQKDEWEDLP